MNLFVLKDITSSETVLAKEADGSIGSRGEDPGLRGVEGDVKNPEVMSDHMTP